MGDDPYSLPEREMKDFQFRQMKKIRVFDSPDDLPKERSNLLAISNKYGLTFVGQDRVLKVFFTQDIISAAKAQGNTNEIVENVMSQVMTVDLPIHHIALSSNELTLSVCGASEQSALVLDFYDVRTFFNKARPEKRPFASFRPGAAVNTSVQDLKWSPVEAFRLAACLSDGSMMVLDVMNSVALFAQLPASVGITCVCWSPKGKQVAAGKQNATVVQYTPNLQEKKVIPCPNFYSADNPVKVLDVLWLSTFNFAVAYAAADGSPETPPELVVVSLPKKDEKKEEKYLNFSDLVYGTCTERQHHYFLYHVEDWDLVLAASAASIEVSIIAKQDDKTSWELWVLEDASRGELPVTLNNDDTLPVGVGIDYTSQGEIHISEEKKLPPAPTLLILSTDGVLCPFSLLNMNPGAQQLVKAAGNLALDGERPPLAKLSSAPPPQAPTVSSTPAFFQVPSTTAIVTPAPTLATMAPGPGSGLISSSGLSFTLPPLASNAGSVFSFSPASSATSAFPSSSSFSFTTLKPSGDAPSASAFSFSALAAKPSTEGTSTLALPLATPAGTQRAAIASPVSVPKGHVEPATPNVRINLNDRFLAAESPAPPVSLAQPFSLSSTPLTDTSVQAAPPFSISKPAAPTAPHPPQTSTQSVPVQKAAPVPIAPPAATATQALSVKALEKQLQQKKDSDPVMVGILEEITHFQKEMDELKARSTRADFLVGSSEEMSDLRKESDHLHVFTLEIKETTESLHGDISTLKTTLLEGFAGVEEARSQSELNRSKDYLLLLYKKPLDPRSEQQLKEIRRLYQYVKFAVEDVNDVLDLEWEKHLEKKKKQKHMIVPEREALYTALANNMDIINTQKQKLDQLVRDLQSLRLYNKTSAWSTPSQPTSAPSPGGLDNELESLRNTLLKSNLEDTPKVPSKSPSKMTPVKQTQLRNFLSKRQTPPVRSTAPANLSRSAFLSPKYFEDLDEVSSTSSLSQTLEPEEFVAVAEEEEEEEEPIPVPTLVPAAPRHPTVVRTSSVQPGFSVQSASFCRVPSGPGPGSSPVVPKINMDSADSTALATKTVKHGAPPTEKTTPTTIPAPQAAGRAALNRQMISQKPAGASLTEFTLKSVPQVVNVQELKAKGPAMPGSTIISSSVPAPAAQVVQQALATMEAKRNSSQATGKISLPVAETLTGPQAFVFGAASKTEAPAASTSTPTLGEQSSKGFSFSTGPPGGFSFCLSSSSSSSPPGTTSQAKDVPPVGKFSFGSGTGKMLFSASETPISLTPKPGSSALPTSSSAPPPSIDEPTKLISTAPSFQAPKAQGVTGETLGSFSGLRVGQADEVKEPPKTSVNFTFGQSGNGVLATGFTFGSSQPKPVAAGNGLESAGAADSSKGSNPAAAAGIFKPSELVLPSTTKQGFSVIPTSSVSSTATSFSSLLAAPLPPETTSTSEKPTAVGPSPEPEPSLAVQQEDASSELSPEAPPPSTPSPASVPEETPPSQPAVAPVEKPLTQPAPALEVTPTPPPLTSPPAEPTPLAEPSAPTPATETAPAHTPSPAPLEQPPAMPAAVTAPAVTAATAPPPATPGSIFAQPVSSANSATLSVTSFTPVISTASTAASSVSVTPLGPSTTCTTPALVFGQPASTTSAPVFGASSFGAASTTSGFGKPVFGQVTATAGFGQPAPGSASGFTFGQSSFGSGSGFGQTPAAATAAPASSSGGGLFGSASTSSASSFSFGASSTSSGVSTRAGIFGQTSTPAFGQPSTAFGQGCLFGSNTTTTTSSGFGFGQQTAGFGSTPTPSVFGQPPSTASVFGQPSSGGGLFGSGAGNTTSSAGGFFSGLGGKPSEDAANKNPFGTTATGGFGQTSQAGSTSLFGNSGAKAFGFGGSAFGDQKASGTFSAGGGTVATQGFGSFSTPAKTGSFGSGAVFSSPPAFGNSPAFGGSATFGTSPTFNNQMGSAPSKVFGEGTAAASMGGFGFASPPSAPAFGSMAPQSSAPSFGGLAQQAPSFGAQSTGFSSFASPGGFSGFGSTNTNQSSSQTFGGWRS